MSVVVAEGVVEVTADATGVPRQVAKDIEGGGSSVEAAGAGMGKKVFGGVLAGWAAIGGASAVVGYFSGAVTGASDLNETMSASATIFGSAASTVESWGSRAATAVGLSKAAAVEAATGFGNMFTQLGWTSEAAADLSTKTVQVAADLGSFRNLPTADVSDRISAALRGEYDSLQALIPNINAARVEQEAMAATGKTSAAQLTAQEKAAAVLAIVQKDGAAAMGDFAKTSEGAANKSKIVTAELENQQAKLGKGLLPIWQGFLGFMGDSVIPMFTTVVDWMGKNGDTMLMLAGVAAGAAITYGVLTGAVALHTAFTTASAAATGGLTVGQWALNAALGANPIGLVVVAIAALVAGIIWVATQTTFFQDVWLAATGVIGTAATWLWENAISPVFTAIGGIFTWVYETIILPIVTGIMIYIGLWAAVITWLWGSVISPIFTAIGGIFTWVYNSVIVPVVAGIGAYINVLGAVFTWLWANAISPAFNAVATGFNWVWGSVISPVVGFISGAISTIGGTVSRVFSGMAGVIGGAFQSVLGVIRGPINGIIGLVNSAIRGVNSLSVTIPAWVPGVGGQTFGVHIPTIPMLARGSANAPGTFIAGESGPELVTGAGGARVYPADQTRNMMRRSEGGDDTAILAALAALLEAIKTMPRPQINAPITFPDTDDMVVKARQFARGINDYLEV